jgi:hypothetical protein
MPAWPSDLRSAFRHLLKRPGLTAAAMAALALGAGAHTAVFSIVNDVMSCRMRNGRKRLAFAWPSTSNDGGPTHLEVER